MRILKSLYTATILDHPRVCLAVLALVVALLASQTPKFTLDASSDSLLLESDSGIEYYRSIRARYGSDDFLILTYTPDRDLFSDAVLERLAALRDELTALPGVASVVSILDVPLLQSPPLDPRQLSRGAPTLTSDAADRALARTELTNSPLYANRLMSLDGGTTALQINLQRDAGFRSMLEERAALRAKRLDTRLSEDELKKLAELDRRVTARRDEQTGSRRETVAAVREIVTGYRNDAEMHLGGLPMINTDMITFIRHDLVVFGTSLVVALALLLAIIFRRLRWVLLPLVSCAATVTSMIGVLALAGWPVTVVSSNFISLMLILTLSLNIHLAVRYRELHKAFPDRSRRELVTGMIRSKFGPAMYTALTTMVAFASLVASDIRPVMDFGWMMVLGMLIAFVLTFTWLPAVLLLLPSDEPPALSRITDNVTSAFMRVIRRFPVATLTLYALLAVLAGISLTRLSVDNRFIDYFKESTAIHQGMQVIDSRLGGTTPLDVVLDADPAALEPEPEDDELMLPGDAGLAAESYWYNASRIDTIRSVHEFLESRDDIGKVLSLVTTVDVMSQLLDKDRLENFELSLVHQRMPDDVRDTLIAPYLSADGNQARLAARVFETGDNLKRNELLTSIRDHLSSDLGIAPERVHLTGLMVLYNNVLQSLLRSQLVTVGVVILAIWIMFVVSFRSVAVAAVALVPNVIGAAIVLGLMSVLGIPLDIMTISIAAIAIGIGVDNTIHYVYRFQEEFDEDRDYRAVIERCHCSVGHAMYYTSITILLGFSILALSSFVPTIYFGLLTGLAMIVTLIANLTLLPLLLARLNVLGDPVRNDA